MNARRMAGAPCVHEGVSPDAVGACCCGGLGGGWLAVGGGVPQRAQRSACALIDINRSFG